jgi:hypothetical protein
MAIRADDLATDDTCTTSAAFSVKRGIAAGLVFAFTMSSFIFSDLRALGQIGTTIGLGLLFDTLIVRSLMTPSIAASSVGGSGGRYTRALALLAGCCARTEPTAPCDNCLGQAVALTLVTAR